MGAKNFYLKIFYFKIFDALMSLCEIIPEINDCPVSKNDNRKTD